MFRKDSDGKKPGSRGLPIGMRWLALGLAAVFLLAACGTGGGAPQTFQLSVPEAVSGPQGCNVSFQTYITRLPGTTGPVTVSISGLPAGAVADTLTIPAGVGEGTLTLRLGTASPGTTNLTVTATLGSETRTGTVRLTVQAASPDGVCPEIPATTKVTDQASRQALSEFTNAGGNYTLRFSQATPVLLNLQPGDVLVSAPSERAPGGYLVKVTAVRQEGGGVVVTGTQARIEEAIHQGQLMVNDQPLTPAGPVEYLANGVRVSRISPQFERSITFEINNAVLYDFHEGGVSARLVMNGRVTATVGLDLVVDIRTRVGIPPVYLHRFLAQGRAQLNGRFEVSGEARGSISREIPIARVPFSTITFTIGPVPVVVVPSMVFSVGASGEVSVSLYMGTVMENYAAAGIEYVDGRGWQPIQEFRRNISWLGPELTGALEVRGYARAGLGLDVYGVPTASVGLSAYARLWGRAQSNPSCLAALEYGLHAGIDASVGLDVTTAIGLPAVRYDINIFDLRLTGGFSACPPTVQITSPGDGASVDLNRNFTVVVNATDPMGQPVTLAWDPAPLSSSGTSASYRFTREGPQRITVTGTTGDGRRNQASIQVNVVNSPPRASIDIPGNGQSYYLNPTATVAARGSGSDVNEDDPNVLSCSWAVAPDNLEAEGCSISFTFSTPGNRTLRLVVRDPQGLASEPTEVTISVQNPPPNYPPTASIAVTPASDPYTWNQTLTLTATDPRDPEGNTPLSFTWRAIKVDGSGNPFGSVLNLGSTQTVSWNLGTAHSFLTEPGSTCQSTGQRVRLELVVTDSLGNAMSPWTDSRIIRVECPPG
ncbi:hypothetical protein ACKLNZ_00705 [Thermus scotoductus]